MPKETVEIIVTELDHEEDWRRMRATATCLKGGPKVVALVIEAMKTGSPAYKIEAARMLARIRDPQAGVPLVELMQGEDESVREAVVASLEQMAGVVNEETATALVELLKNETLRPSVTKLLGVIPTSIGPLTAMLKDPDSVGRLLQGFTDMGMGIALDDFGTGYSSLTHLRRFSVTTIKIDRSFITNLCSSQDDAAIVSAIVGMGRSLRLRTLAEGIETSEQLAFLRQLNCDSMQGYYFSKPLPAEAVTNELFERNLYDLEPAPSISAAGAD